MIVTHVFHAMSALGECVVSEVFSDWELQRYVFVAWMVACYSTRGTRNLRSLSQPLLGGSEGHGAWRGCTALI
jgi:hypothetical protein